MPRSARLDVPNVLQHVMARGIEGREIFRLLAHEEAGESMSALCHLCGFAHTSVSEAIERAREEGKRVINPQNLTASHNYCTILFGARYV